MARTKLHVLLSGCAALLVFSSAVGVQAAAVLVAKHENLLHERNVTAGTNASPFFTAHTDGTPFLPANGWFPISTVQAAAPGTSSSTPKKSFTFVGDSTAAGNWTDGNGIPAGITLTFDAQFTVSAITTTEPALVLTVQGLSGTNQSGRGIGLTTQQDVNGLDDINNGRGLLFSPVIVSNINFSGTLADPNFTLTPNSGNVSGFGTELFESGQFNETTQGMTLTQGADAIVDPGEGTIGFGLAPGTIASGLKMDLGFGPYHTGTPPAPPNASSAFPRQSGPYTMITTHGSGSVFRGMTIGYDVTYDISPAGATPDADFDGDNDVDGADFLIWQRGVGTAGGQPQGNADGAGNIDGADLAVWKGQFASSTVAAAAVPEPASALIVICAAVGAAATQFGRRRG